MNEPRRRRSSVVIVEDDAGDRRRAGAQLKLQGYRTEVAGDGEAAAALIDSARPDLVLLDISLPKQSGIWVLETLRGAGNQVPVIVLSARQDEFDKVAALRLGADDYVTKPFALAELLARVAAVLRRARPERPARRRRRRRPRRRRRRPFASATSRSICRRGPSAGPASRSS